VGGRGEPILKVCRLVLETFDRERLPHESCRHMNGNSLDDRRRNLKWGTASEQHADKVRHGTNLAPPVFRGVDNHMHRYGDEVYANIIELRRQGLSSRAIAARTGVSKSQILRRLRAEEVCRG
jgi:hypothetical protein